MTAPAGPLLILADTYRLARQYAREHRLGREGAGWRYACEPRHVRGRRDGRYVLLRLTDSRLSRRELEDRWEALQILQTNGFTNVEDRPRR